MILIGCLVPSGPILNMTCIQHFIYSMFFSVYAYINIHMYAIKLVEKQAMDLEE